MTTEFFYAQINPSSICYAVTQTSGEILQDDMIPIASYDTSLLGMRWQDGGWVVVEPEPDPDVPPDSAPS